MAGYLEEYGVADERRSKVIRWIVISAISCAVLGTVLYFTLRTYPAKRHVGAFLDDLRRHDYQTAYKDWGCAKGCPEYTFENFLRDWGPQSPYANAADARIKRVRYCGAGVILTLESPQSPDLPLWYERDNGTLGFAPWPVCAEHIPAPTGATPAP
jgi:hypothetical protein